MSEPLPGGERIDQIPIELSFERGQELLDAMVAGPEEAREVLAAVALDKNGYFNVETGKLATVIFVPRPDFRLVRRVCDWPAGTPRTTHSDEPINTRIIYPPSQTLNTWRLASSITPSPDYRYQELDFEPSLLAAQGHSFAVGAWRQPKIR